MRWIKFCLAIQTFILGSSLLRAESPTEIYQRRVIPLLQSSNASSCTECHLQGIKLEDFLTSDPKASFASLRARGWIDTEKPSNSKLLEFISKRSENSTALMDQVRQSELEAIGAWIEASVKDPDSLNTPLPKWKDLELDESLIRHSRQDRVVSRFVDLVWSQFERCANCHSPDRNEKQVEKHGKQMSWIVPNSPSQTLLLLEERKLIHLEKPEASLLRTKALGRDEHGGGVKFPEGGQTDREWERFLSDYVALKQARYGSSKDVPSFQTLRTWRTGLHLRVKDLPKSPAGQYAVMLMYRVHTDGRVADEATAMGEGRVGKEGVSWSTTLMLLEPRGSRHSQSSVDWDSLLPDGKYQLRWLVVDDPSLSIEEILKLPASMQTDIAALWKTGHSGANTLSYKDFKAIEYSK